MTLISWHKLTTINSIRSHDVDFVTQIDNCKLYQVTWSQVARWCYTYKHNSLDTTVGWEPYCLCMYNDMKLGDITPTALTPLCPSHTVYVTWSHVARWQPTSLTSNCKWAEDPHCNVHPHSLLIPASLLSPLQFLTPTELLKQVREVVRGQVGYQSICTSDQRCDCCAGG